MKPNQCRWCKKFTQQGQLKIVCDKCLIKSESRNYELGRKHVKETYKDYIPFVKRTAFIEGFVSGAAIFTLTIIAIIYVTMKIWGY